jgi:hypothetical protein
MYYNSLHNFGFQGSLPKSTIPFECMERTFSDGRDILGMRLCTFTNRTLILCRDYLKKQAERSDDDA